MCTLAEVFTIGLSALLSPGGPWFTPIQWISDTPLGGPIFWTGLTHSRYLYTNCSVLSLAIILKIIICFSIKVRHIGFSTGWGSVGEFKIWRKEDSDENHNEAFTLGVPHNMVPGSERATAYMIGKLFFTCVYAYAVHIIVCTISHINWLLIPSHSWMQLR